MIGQTLSHYRIVEKLGEGGMGVVWKAVDTHLDRQVAIKVLPEQLAQDVEYLARFEREAKLLATLNHRNIAAIYGLEEAAGRRFLVMELIEGEDLSRRLAGGPLPVEEAINLCHQLARALEAAHDKGVLHRDLKPANVQVTHEGHAKVLDFGLAKAFEEQGDIAKSPTLTTAGTRAGTILGTAGYMSPEQARAKPLDKRTDIWSFGCVLYECLTGRSPFRGETVSDTLAAILKTEADWTLLPERTPARVRDLLQRCLEKDSRNRLRDIGDARIELERSISGRESLGDASGAVPVATGGVRRARKFSLPAVAAVALAGVLAGALASWLLAGRLGFDGSGPTGVTRLTFRYPKDLVVGETTLLSPDGSTILFSAVPRQSSGSDQDPGRLYLRRLDRYEVEPVVGSDGVVAAAFSPDGRWIAMLTPVTPRSTQRRLSKVPVDGSAPPLILREWPQDWTPQLLWLPGGEILAGVAEPRSVVRIPADGSPAKSPIVIKTEGFEGQFFFTPANGSVLPDGVHVLGGASTYAKGGFDQSVAVLNTQTGVARILVENGGSPQWSPTGHLLFSRGDTLLAVPFDPDELAPAGGQVAITDGLRANAIWQDAAFQLTPGGTLLHWPGGLVGGSRRLAVLDRHYAVVGEWSDDRRPFEAGLAISRNGRRLAVAVVDAQGLYGIWASDVDRPSLTQLVRRAGEDCVPQLWSPAADRLVYSCSTTTGGALYIGPGDGAGEPRTLLKSSATELYTANDFLAGESELVLTHLSAGKPELVLLPLEVPKQGEATPTKLVADASAASLSPDGRWLAYSSDSSGRFEVYVRRIEAGGSLGTLIPVTRSGGANPQWRRGEGAAPLELQYSVQSKVWSVIITTEPPVSISEPRAVSGDLTELIQKFRGGMDDLPDGRSIAILAGANEEPPTEASVVLHWLTELKQRLAETH